jgi:carbon-monoxide dehydrogenase medium subunit
LDASVCLGGPDGERIVPIKDFFTGPGETVRRENELILEIVIPETQSQAAFLKLGKRKSQTLSVVNAAVSLGKNGGKCTNVRIAVGAMAPTPLRCVKAEEALQDKQPDAGFIRDCARIAVEQTDPIDDGRASAWYRKRAAEAVISRAIATAAGMEL